MLEAIRPEIMQYFVEADTDGTPISRMFRTLIYQRASKVNDTVPFGTLLDLYQVGYEWMDHSIYTENIISVKTATRVEIGGPDCTKPYDASVLNISAMSYGSLSNNAIMALNKGAKEGGFLHNTGEGSISPYHLKYGGDLVWQIGTGYFGCRSEDGKFDIDMYTEKAKIENVKMIEIKLSQGAKPGHGGILPASKNTEEIAKIRGLKPNIKVYSPPNHTAFTSPISFMEFIKLLRDKSGGKPVGFKICIGKKTEFINLCRTMISTGIKPDFITIDGGEGGTGAAPIEFSNSLGMPLLDGLAFVYDTLVGFGLKQDIIIIASGKILTSFHIAKLLALGADVCNSARAMMLAVGCIQSLKCNANTCPVGVATQDERFVKGLDVDHKAKRVYNFHHETVKSLLNLITAVGITRMGDLNREHVNRRVSNIAVMKYSEIYPYTKEESLL
jgi:glutamate synthase domain-containing protein 2